MDARVAELVGADWSGQDAYVVGGGPSLRDFDWDLLRGRRTVGCNSAFALGADRVEVVAFADAAWWEGVGSHGLPGYRGVVVACSPAVSDGRVRVPDWVRVVDREEARCGLATTPGRLGFNGNTGALAINLALALGARRVHLLGFDMQQLGGRANWHDLRHERDNPGVYRLFRRQLALVARDLPRVYPGREVVNLSDGASALDAFPVQSLSGHFSEAAGCR